MNTTRNAILLLDAIRQADLLEIANDRTGGGETGVFVANDSGMTLTSLIHEIAETLDYRVVILDAASTNLNDLDVWDSPLREKARFAFSSDKTYVFLLRGWVPAMAVDPRIANFRRCFGGTSIAMISSETDDRAPEGFVRCDLSGKAVGQ